MIMMIRLFLVVVILVLRQNTEEILNESGLDSTNDDTHT